MYTFILSDRPVNSISNLQVTVFSQYMVKNLNMSNTTSFVGIYYGARIFSDRGNFNITVQETWTDSDNMSDVTFLCLLSTFRASNHSCIPDQSIQVTLTLVLSVPSITLFLRWFSPLIRFID